MTDPAAIQPLPLCQLKVGDCGVIVEKKLEESDRAMLRSLGLEANSTVRICRAGEPCIVAVMTGGTVGGRLGDGCCRIGLARPFAERIFVAPSPSREP